jgi:hypothetical protein
MVSSGRMIMLAAVDEGSGGTKETKREKTYRESGLLEAAPRQPK